jgi:hypothetical protein
MENEIILDAYRKGFIEGIEYGKEAKIERKEDIKQVKHDIKKKKNLVRKYRKRMESQEYHRMRSEAAKKAWNIRRMNGSVPSMEAIQGS